MRCYDQAVELLIAIICQSKDRPVIAAGASPHFDAADDAVGGRSGRHLDAVAVGMLQIDGVGQIDRLRVAMDVNGFNRAGRGSAKHDRGDGKRGEACTGSRPAEPAAQPGSKPRGGQRSQTTPSVPASGAHTTQIQVPRSQ